MIAGHPDQLLANLFEGFPVIVEEVRLSEKVPEPHPLEAEQVAGAVLRRRVEFAAGRYCARRALSRLNIGDFVLRNGADRAPQWPHGVVGAITHTGRADDAGYCGVVVARVDDVVTVGLDAEEITPLAPSLWSYVLTQNERRALDAGASGAAGALAKTIFSAKECFYKAQFPLSRRFLRFHDVEIAVDSSSSRFEARLTSDAPKDLPLTECSGRFISRDALVLTGIAIAA